MAAVQKYLNPLILNPKTLFKIENSFYSPFTFWPASSLRLVLLFLRIGPLHSAFRPSQPTPSLVSFLQPKWSRHRRLSHCPTLHRRCPPPCAMETRFESLPHGLHSPLNGHCRYSVSPPLQCFETIGHWSHWRPPLYSALPPWLTAPAYKRRREHPLPPPRPIPPPVSLLRTRVTLAPSFTAAICSSPSPTLPHHRPSHQRPWWGPREPPLHFGVAVTSFGTVAPPDKLSSEPWPCH
jgi:hypothetical protein